MQVQFEVPAVNATKNICQTVYATSLTKPLVPVLNAQYEMQKTRT
jgi:hypothetical protein